MQNFSRKEKKHLARRRRYVGDNIERCVTDLGLGPGDGRCSYLSLFIKKGGKFRDCLNDC